jgi:hypothetical protein
MTSETRVGEEAGSSFSEPSAEMILAGAGEAECRGERLLLPPRCKKASSPWNLEILSALEFGLVDWM